MLYQLSYVSEFLPLRVPRVPTTLPRHAFFTRAGDGARTRDIKLGRLALYQLSYSRIATPLLLLLRLL